MSMAIYTPPEVDPPIHPGDRVDDSVVLEGSCAETGVVLCMGSSCVRAEVFTYGTPRTGASAEVYPLGDPMNATSRELLIEGGFGALDSDAKILDFARNALIFGDDSGR